MITDLFQSCGHCWVFQICWYIECSTFTVSSFRIWNSSIGIPWHPLALFIVMLSKAHLTSHSRMPGSRWVITPLWLSGSWSSFLYSSSVQFFLPPLLNIFCFCYIHTISVLYQTHLWVKCSLGISNFLEEISSLSHSVILAEMPILQPPHAKSWLTGKDPDAGRDCGQEENGMTEDEMAGWHHRLGEHEFE